MKKEIPQKSPWSAHIREGWVKAGREEKQSRHDGHWHRDRCNSNPRWASPCTPKSLQGPLGRQGAFLGAEKSIISYQLTLANSQLNPWLEFVSSKWILVIPPNSCWQKAGSLPSVQLCSGNRYTRYFPKAMSGKQQYTTELRWGSDALVGRIHWERVGACLMTWVKDLAIPKQSKYRILQG